MNDQSKRQAALYKYKSANPTKEKGLEITSIQTKPTTCHLLQPRLSSARLIANVMRPYIPCSYGPPPQPNVFEYLYIALTESIIDEINPDQSRKLMGHKLAVKILSGMDRTGAQRDSACELRL